ncbi:hypothetical protein GQ457_01G036150 [Hibiscus cannabinus]
MAIKHLQSSNMGGTGTDAVEPGRKGSKLKAYCCWAGVRLTGSAVRGVGRCLFVSCYPVMQCFGLDDCRHHHHHHKHFH